MKRELVYAAAVGGCVGALMTMVLGLVMSLGAQNEAPADWKNGYFNEITCRSVRVGRGDGEDEYYDTMLTPLYVVVGRKDGRKVSISSAGVSVDGILRSTTIRDDSIICPSVRVGRGDGGGIKITPQNIQVGERDQKHVIIQSGGVLVFGENRAHAVMNSDYINLVKFDDNDFRAVELSITEHGGNVAVFGKGNDKTRAVMAVNEYGNGVVNTWD